MMKCIDISNLRDINKEDKWKTMANYSNPDGESK